MSDRIPCCIRGCRRTFRAERCGNGPVICGRHYRCAPELKRLLLQCLRLWRKLRRRYPHIDDPFDVKWQPACSTRTVARAMRAVCERFDRRWKALVVEAQRQQDAGFFDRRRPQPKKDRHIVNPLSSKFEQQFQRMKAAMP